MVLLDVDQHHERAAHRACLVLVGDHVAADVALLAAGPEGLALVGDRLPGQGALDQRLALGEHRRRRELAEVAPDHRLARQPRPRNALRVGEAQDAFAVDVGDGKADGVGDEGELALARGDGRLRLLQVLEVHDQHGHAEHLARLADRVVVGAHPAALVGTLHRKPVEDLFLAGQRAGEHGTPLVRRFLEGSLAQRAAKEFRFLPAGEVEVGAVHVAVAKPSVDHAAGQAEQVEARLQVC